MNQRLILHKITLHNFKSYSGTCTLGPFKSSFNAIIGPNGSGKSNLIDALQFVFGRNGKQLRAKKVSELVHNSDGKATVCVREMWVRVEFKEIDEEENEVDMLVVERRFSSNVSSYFLNGESVKMKAISEILQAKGVDLENSRFLILQGEVEKISLMKPNEHLEFLEKIIGSDHFIDRIEKANQKYTQIRQERELKAERMRQSEYETEVLEGPKKAAESYLEKKAEKEKTCFHLHSMKRETAIENSKIVSVEIENLKKEKNNYSNKIREIKLRYSSNDNEYLDHTRLYKRLLNDIEEGKEKLVSVEKSLTGCKRDIKNTAKSRASLLQKMKKESAEVLNKSIERYSKKQKELTQELESTKHHIENAEVSLRVIVNEHSEDLLPIQRKIEQVQQKLLPYQQKLEPISTEKSIAKSELELLIHSLHEEEEQEESIKKQAETSSKAIQEKENSIVELKSKNEEIIHKTIPQCEIQIQELSKRHAQIESEYYKAKVALSDIKSSSRNMQEKVYESVMEWKGSILGIHDSLHYLGTIPEKYQTALLSAAKYFDAIVVDSPKVASECVKRLKRENIGTGKFLMMDKVQQSFAEEKRKRRKQHFPSNSIRLIDLIEFDPKYEAVFHFSVKNTLVAENLAQAREWAFGGKYRHRVVTLGGEIIEPHGVMSSFKKRGIHRSSGLSSEKATVQVNSLYKELHEIVQQRAQVMSQIDDLRREHHTNVIQLRKLEMSLQMLKDTTIIETESMVDESETRYRIVDLQTKVDALNNKENEIKNQSEPLIIELKQLQKDLEEIEGLDVKNARAKLKSLHTELESIQSQLNEIVVKKEHSEKALKNSVQKTERYSKQLKTIDDKILHLKEKKIEFSKRMEEIQEKNQQIIQRKEETQSKMLQSESKREDKNTRIGNLKASIKTADYEISDLERKLRIAKEQEEFWSQEMEKSIHRIKSNLLMLFDGDEDRVDAEIETMKSEMCDEDLDSKLRILEAELQPLKPNLSVLREYTEKKKIYLEHLKQVKEITTQRNEAKLEYENLRRCRLEMFIKGFSKISIKLKEIYQMITLGGDAELELVDKSDPFSQGITISVKPPKKSWKEIGQLSGGEKTLSSLSLIFALHHFKPTPIYIMDEIDAALDLRNVAIVGHYLQQQTRNAQFVVISLRNQMFELANRLVGVYKVDDKTKNLIVDPEEISIVDQENQTALHQENAAFTKVQKSLNKSTTAFNPLQEIHTNMQ